MSLQPGDRFAGFTIERKLGAGGMGTVYLAVHPRLRRKVALKVLANAFVADPKTRAAFDREARVAAGLDHPNIVAVYDRSAADDPDLWLTMRYIDGGDASVLLDTHPAGLDPARAVRLLTGAAHALDYAHAQGVLHRDVKPANLLIEHSPGQGERAVLTDFGIARTLDDTVTLSGIAATFAYAAPERFTDAAADHRADIYSLGCTLFQLLTGKTPFPRKDQAAVIGAHLSAPPPAPREQRPELPAELDAVIATALAKSPQDRFATCTELAEAAARALPPEVPVVHLEKARPVQISSPAPDQALVPTVIRAPQAGASTSLPALTPQAGAGNPPAALTPQARASAPPAAPTTQAGASAAPAAPTPRAGAGDPPAAPTPQVGASAPSPAPTPRAGAGDPAARLNRRRRYALLSALALAGVAVLTGVAFTARDQPAADQTTTSTTVSTEQPASTTTTPAPSAPPPPEAAAQAETHESIAPAPPTQQYVPPVQRPQNPATQAPQVVPQTRVHQWPG
ncbi:protein kinase [Nocardia sp. NPDC050712]|uniref:serine/threonine-protein kinase n=1 Tax=Nocardia sp. NPDC050712 TaxID=3155518 RepID=UPI0033E1CCC9